MNKGPDHPISTFEKIAIAFAVLTVIACFLTIARLDLLDKRMNRIEDFCSTMEAK